MEIDVKNALNKLLAACDAIDTENLRDRVSKEKRRFPKENKEDIAAIDVKDL